MSKKMVKVRFTDDPKINRMAIEPEILEMMDLVRETFGGRLVSYEVEQGSESAARVTAAKAEYARRHQK